MRNFHSNSLRWLPWVGAIVVVGFLGGALGLAGAFGHPATLRSVFSNAATLARTAAAYECPGGPVITRLQAGDRVVAIARSSDGGYLGLRNPLNIAQTVWVQSRVVSLDKGENSASSLPEQACPVASIALGTVPSAPPPVVVTPVKPTKPIAPAPDATPPTLGTPTAGTPIVCVAISNPPHTDTISVAASDNVGVTSVSISWSGAASGSASMTPSGSTWIDIFDAGTSTATGTITFQMQARDAAGNLSAIKKVSITQAGCVG